MGKENCYTGGDVLVYSCSGGSDVGHVADLSARKLSKEGFGKKACLAAVGAHLSRFVELAKGTDLNITIDGCPVSCAKKCLEHIGVNPKSYFLSEMGYVKGKTPPSDEVVNKVCESIKKGVPSDTKKTTSTNNTGKCCC